MAASPRIPHKPKEGLYGAPVDPFPDLRSRITNHNSQITIFPSRTIIPMQPEERIAAAHSGTGLKGSVLALMLHDIAEEIRLEQLREMLGAQRVERSFKHATPEYVRFEQPPVVERLEPITLAFLLVAPENNRLLLEARTTSPPDPTPSGTAMLDTTILAHGDLGVTLDVPPHAQAGQLLDFHARLVYTGDVPISAAHLNVYLPWSSGARGVSCTATNAGACTTDLAAGNVRATIDLNPGAVVDVTGQVLVLPLDNNRETASVGAVGFGPVGLSETDTVNNLARVVVSQGVFADGFDGN